MFERKLTRVGGHHRVAPRRGFTLIELLVVVAIIAMLLAVLMPSLSRAKEQAKAVKCLAHLRELGHGMMIYYDEWGNYPTHQWRLPDNSRIRWFNAMADALAGLEVQACPATEWAVGRNNSYGYNYKNVGSTRDNARADNPWRPYECFPVRHLQAPSKTIAFAEHCDRRKLGGTSRLSRRPPSSVPDELRLPLDCGRTLPRVWSRRRRAAWPI